MFSRVNFKFSFFKFGVVGIIKVCLGLFIVYNFDRFVKCEGKDKYWFVVLFLF